MAKKRAEAPADAANRAVWPAAIDSVAGIIRAAIYTVGTLGVVLMLREPLIAMAGKTTAVRLQGALNVTANIPADVTLSVNWFGTIALLGSAVACLLLVGIVIGQRRNYESTVLHLAGRGSRLEELIDRQRTTSGLTREGRTNPADR